MRSAASSSRLLSAQPAPSTSFSVTIALLGTAAVLAAVGYALRPGRTRRAAAKPMQYQARRLHRAAGTMAACVLVDSAIEHYRGSFHNRGMFAPLVSAALALGASGSGTTSPFESAGARRTRDVIYAFAGATGLIGTAFHVYNIGKRTGGFSWLNFFYAAPIAAPAALAFVGVLGLAVNRLHEQPNEALPKVLGVPAGRMLAALTSVGILGTVGEVAMLHFRGAFQNPAMYLPVSVPPVAAALLARSAFGAAGRDRAWTRWWLRLTGLLGLLGTLLHANGVGRAMGGWRNWSQNVLNGPPVPAPPSFTALALSGLAALELLRVRDR